MYDFFYVILAVQRCPSVHTADTHLLLFSLIFADILVSSSGIRRTGVPCTSGGDLLTSCPELNRSDQLAATLRWLNWTCCLAPSRNFVLVSVFRLQQTEALRNPEVINTFIIQVGSV